MSTREAGAGKASEFIEDVRRGLNSNGQKQLHPRFFYDDIGSSLFEVITQLPEYGLTRADERLISQHASDVVQHLGTPTIVAELGSGSGAKTRWILQELTRQGPVRYLPIDISMAALELCEAELRQLAGVHVEALAYPYLDGLKRAVSSTPTGTRLLVLFLGSTIGNFDRPSAKLFLENLRSTLRSDDALILGTDLEKPIPVLLAAYDDPTGVTAAFNRNILARINRELNGNFDLKAFDHYVRYDELERRIEMHLRATSSQEVRIAAADMDVTLRKDETIWTESSHKFSPDEVVDMGNQAGFRCIAQWLDSEWPFAETMFVAG